MLPFVTAAPIAAPPPAPTSVPVFWFVAQPNVVMPTNASSVTTSTVFFQIMAIPVGLNAGPIPSAVRSGQRQVSDANMSIWGFFHPSASARLRSVQTSAFSCGVIFARSSCAFTVPYFSCTIFSDASERIW